MEEEGEEEEEEEEEGEDEQRSQLFRAAKEGRVEGVLKLLPSQDVDVSDKLGDTLLHVACLHRHPALVQALLKAGADFKIVNKLGHTPLHSASIGGNSEVVQMLLAKGADVNAVTKTGSTPLHCAAYFNHVQCVRTLLSFPGINLSIKDVRGRTAVMVAREYNVLNLLNKYVKNCEDFPIHSFGKVILCGHTGAGKSTLAQVIIGNSVSGSPEECSKRMEQNLKSVKMHTAGIIPHYVKVPNGNIVLYDLAGHTQYYSSHASCLETISLHSPSTFLLLSDLSNGDETLKKEFTYWCGLIGNVSKAQRSSVIVVGTHADKSKPLGDMVVTQLVQHFKTIIKEYNLNFIQFITLDVTAYQSGGMMKFISTLYETVETVKSQGPPISLNSHILYAFLKALNMDAITLSDLLSRLAQEKEQSLPTSTEGITPLLSTLSDRGLVTFFSSPNPSDSWIVIRPEALLSEIIGALFAPKFFPEKLHLIASKIGLVQLSSLQAAFSKHNIDMILQFLFHFELCQKVPGRMFTSGSTPDALQHEMCVFFPAFVDVKRPSTVTAGVNSLVWVMHTADATQFYTVRFLQVLILRLASRHPLPANKSALEPAFHPISRLCEVWSMGISWNNESAVTIIFEMKELFQCLCLSVDSPDKSYQDCPSLVKTIIEDIKSTCMEICPYVAKNATEGMICPHEAGGPAEVELSSLNVAIKSNSKMVIDTTGKKKIDLNKWKMIEPQLPYIIGIQENKGPAGAITHTGAPELSDLMNEIASQIPVKCRDVGIQLGLSPSALDDIQSENAGKPGCNKLSFEKVFTEWKRLASKPYTWNTIIEVLRTPAVGEATLADTLSKKIHAGSYG